MRKRIEVMPPLYLRKPLQRIPLAAGGSHGKDLAALVPLTLTLLVSLTILLAACNGTPPEGPPEVASTSENDSSQPASPAQTTEEATDGAEPTKSDTRDARQATGKRETVDEVLRKIQPPRGEAMTKELSTEKSDSSSSGQPPADSSAETEEPRVVDSGSPPEEPAISMDREKLLKEAATLADTLADALTASTPDDAMALVISEEQCRKLLTEGGFTILASTVLPANKKSVRQLVDALGGKKVTHEWKPGDLTVTRTGPGMWRDRVPMLIDSALILSADGIPVRVAVPQMLWVEERWRIFRITH